MPQSRNLPNEQLTHLTRSGPIPHPSNIKYIHIYVHARKKTSVKGNRSLRGLNVWRNCCQLFRNRMYFLKLMAWRVLASSCFWVPLLSVLCLPVEPWPPSYPWLVRLPSPGRKILIPCPPTMLWFEIQTLGSDSKDKVPTFTMSFRSPAHQLMHL